MWSSDRGEDVSRRNAMPNGEPAVWLYSPHLRMKEQNHFCRLSCHSRECFFHRSVLFATMKSRTGGLSQGIRDGEDAEK
jgi:hypothetical protein